MTINLGYTTYSGIMISNTDWNYKETIFECLSCGAKYRIDPNMSLIKCPHCSSTHNRKWQ